MELTNRRILITGGAGFIGSYLAERLAEQNFIRILDDFSTGSLGNLENIIAQGNVEVIEGDVRDDRCTVRACESIEVVFHLAVSCLRTSLNRPWLSHEVNAGGTLTLCESALRAGVGRFVYVSSSEVYGSAQQAPMSEGHPFEPTTVYGAAKLAGEHYAKAYQRTRGLPVVIVRPFNTYGPREPWEGHRAEVIPRFVLRGLAGRSGVVFGDGRQSRDFTYVTDTVSGIVRAAECDELVGDVVNVATGRETCILDIAALIAEQMGIDEPVTFAPARPGDVARHVADVGKARRVMSFRASTSLVDGLMKTIEWLQAKARPDVKQCAAAGGANW